MSSRLDGLRERRLALVATCDRDRDQVAAAFGGIERKLEIADRVVSAVQRLNRNRVVMAVVAAGLILVPVLTRKWVRKAAWWLPIVISGVRFLRSRRSEKRARRDDPLPAD
jgi:hypothetical protein